MLHSVLLVIHFICAFSIVGLVLLQRGKGAEAGAGFGAGASGTVFGARGASTALSRATGILAGVFMVTSLSLTYVGSHKAAASSGTILEQLQQQPAQPNSPTSVPVLPGAPTGSEIPSTTPSTTPGDAASAPTAPASAPAAPASGTPPAKK
jgi:preprotein translocase subunit SecG